MEKWKGSICLLLLMAISPFESTPYLRTETARVKKSPPTDLHFTFIGEIIGYSYIKVTIESSGSSKNQRTVVPIKGSYYEAVTGNTYKLIGSYNTKTLIWKFECFNTLNKPTSTFTGKGNKDEGIDGRFTNKSKTYNFYLKKVFG